MPRNRVISSLTTLGVTLAAIAANLTFAALPVQADDPELQEPAQRAVPAQVFTDQFIVGIKGKRAGASAAEGQAIAQAARSSGVRAEDVRPSAAGSRVLKADRPLPPAEAERFLATLRSDPRVEYAEPDAIMQPAATEPNDTYYTLQWDLWEQTGGIGAPGAWDFNRGRGSVVAVVDTGITAHSDLASNVLPGYDMISNASMARDGNDRDSNPNDEGDWVSDNQCGTGTPGSASSWHGTHVAGTVAAVAGNGNGVSGVAPEAHLLPMRALGACGGYTSDIAAAIIWAAGGEVPGAPRNANPANVINLSLGGIAPCSATYQNAINIAYEAGAAVVVAAGNASRPAVDSSPANCPNVITVAASNRAGGYAGYSNYGSAVDVAAPGGDANVNGVPGGIPSTYNMGTTVPSAESYAYMRGTSMAAPHVAGIAALMISERGGALTPAEVENTLKRSARPLPAGCLPGCGAGLVDATAALNLLTPDNPEAKVPGALKPLSPFRALDTRTGAPAGPDSSVSFQVAGVNGIPANVSSVVFNLTVTAGESFGYITAYPSGTARPNASHINFTAGETVPNSVTVPVGADGKVTLYNRSAGKTDLLADISGYYVAGTPTVAGAFQPMAPKRFLDTRQSSPVAPDNSRAFQVAGVEGVPGDASAVVLNLTVAGGESFGYVGAYASGSPVPNASNVNFAAKEIAANAVTVPIGADGKVALFNRSAGATHLVADVSGYYLGGTPSKPGTFQPVGPSRFLDTRTDTKIGPDSTRSFQVAGARGLPSEVSAVVFNLTVAVGESFGYATAYASGTARPYTSNVNFAANQVLPNSVTIPVGADGKVTLFNRSSGATDMVADVAGYFLPG